MHPKAFDFDRVITRSLMEMIEVVENLDTSIYGVLIIDSIIHLWEAARAAMRRDRQDSEGSKRKESFVLS